MQTAEELNTNPITRRASVIPKMSMQHAAQALLPILTELPGFIVCPGHSYVM